MFPGHAAGRAHLVEECGFHDPANIAIRGIYWAAEAARIWIACPGPNMQDADHMQSIAWHYYNTGEGGSIAEREEVEGGPGDGAFSRGPLFVARSQSDQ